MDEDRELGAVETATEDDFYYFRDSIHMALEPRRLRLTVPDRGASNRVLVMKRLYSLADEGVDGADVAVAVAGGGSTSGEPFGADV